MSKTTNLRWKIAQATEIRWWKNYLGQKPKATYLQWKKSYWEELLRKINVALTPGQAVLDAGCGPAGIFTILEAQKTDAVDPLLQQYEQQLEHFSRADYPTINFIHAPLEEFNPGRQYDVVFCLNAINHVADLELCFDKLSALTKSDGLLVVSIDAHNYSFFKTIFRLLPGDILHPHQYDLAEYQKMLTDRNFSIQETVLMNKAFFFDYHILVARYG